MAKITTIFWDVGGVISYEWVGPRPAPARERKLPA